MLLCKPQLFIETRKTSSSVTRANADKEIVEFFRRGLRKIASSFQGILEDGKKKQANTSWGLVSPF
jgi:hypothetical protein